MPWSSVFSELLFRLTLILYFESMLTICFLHRCQTRLWPMFFGFVSVLGIDAKHEWFQKWMSIQLRLCSFWCQTRFLYWCQTRLWLCSVRLIFISVRLIFCIGVRLIFFCISVRLVFISVRLIFCIGVRLIFCIGARHVCDYVVSDWFSFRFIS